MAHVSFLTRWHICLKFNRIARFGLARFTTNEDLEYVKNLRKTPVDKSGDHPFSVKKSYIGDQPVVAKKSNIGDQSQVAKKSNTIDQPVVAKNSNTGDEPVMAKKSYVVDQPIVAKKSYIGDQAVLAKKSYTIAPLINKSQTLRKLIDLGVDLSQLEVKYNAADFLMNLNWETEAAPRLRILLNHACVDEDSLGSYITKNPWIFQQDVDDLQTRVNYLESKEFSKAAIARIVTKSVYWLNISVPKIDGRLNWYKDEFRLTDDELRFVITKNPNLITLGTGYTQLLQFSFEEEMGFTRKETQTLLLKDPKLWTSFKEVISKTFDYLHNKLGISHQLILSYPRSLRVYKNHIEERHEFLKKRNLNQYDPEKPNFVPLYALVGGTDEDFCRNIVKCSVKEYNTFLKSR